MVIFHCRNSDGGLGGGNAEPHSPPPGGVASHAQRRATFDTDEAPRRRKPTSHPLQKRKRSDGDPGGPQTKRFGEGGMGSLLAGVELLAGFPLPEELQMLVAAHVAAPLDRAALCIAVPPLGQKAIKGIPAYKGPLMSLGNRVLSGGVEVRPRCGVTCAVRARVRAVGGRAPATRAQHIHTAQRAGGARRERALRREADSSRVAARERRGAARVEQSQR